MDQGTRRVITFLIMTFLLALTVLANRKKIGNALQRRVSKINHRHKNFVHAVGKRL